MSTQPHAKFDGRVVVVVNDDANVASIGYDDIHQETGRACQVFFREGLDVFFADHFCAMVLDETTTIKFYGTKKRPCGLHPCRRLVFPTQKYTIRPFRPTFTSCRTSCA